MSIAGGQASAVGSRRVAIVEAMVRVAGRKGYAAVSVADAIEEAGVSRTTFYKHFDDRRECFLAAYDLAVERVLATVATACAEEAAWLDRARAGLAAAIELFAAEPELARTAVVEAAAGGAETRRRQIEAIDSLARALDAGREAGGPQPLPAETGFMAVSAVNGLLIEQVQAGRATELPERLPDLLFALLVPFLGPKRAVEEMGRGQVESLRRRKSRNFGAV